MNSQRKIRFAALLCLGSVAGFGFSAAAAVPDEDTDGVADRDDRCMGTIPGRRVDLWGCATAPNLVLPTIVFPLDSTRLTASERTRLDQLVQDLKTHPDKQLAVDGHTCSLGSEGYNENLSTSRAKAVASYLRRNGVDSRQLVMVEGFGESRPQVSNVTEEGRHLNRRVIFRSLN